MLADGSGAAAVLGISDVLQSKDAIKALKGEHRGWRDPSALRRHHLRLALRCAGRLCAAAPVLAATILVAACAETGDFGRPTQTAWSNAIEPSVNSHAAGARGQPPSRFVPTNDEQELRSRAWRFLMPAYDRSLFDDQLARFARNQSLPGQSLTADPATYYNALVGEPYRSPSSRYNRLADDVTADRKLLVPFRAVAGRVVSADRVRRRSMDALPLSGEELQDARSRLAENIGLILWVREEVALRICRYRYALDHLVVAGPQTEAIMAERSLGLLEQEARALDALEVRSLIGDGPTEIYRLPPTPLACAPVPEPAPPARPRYTK
ncbi:hypothetical protein QNA08_12455 [Chelatococcus sp. SYSU_G07232]|uniref:Uncharacterized protein n=1 Tax=Chelatococcus albus TaxID=3047466 RepID=A0ABT7AI55_9HYPH|nr:hypothetical protein [Chelatococcus sp. SYSU_G07232]MDJ1159048.1 hypothetical protein [Chelatococcus sp. SYSU_G07232]